MFCLLVWAVLFSSCQIPNGQRLQWVYLYYSQCESDGPEHTVQLATSSSLTPFAPWFNHMRHFAGTCSSSSSAYFWRLSSFSVPSRSSLSRWASCLAALISSLSFCSRFTFSTSTVRCSSWAICSLRGRNNGLIKMHFDYLYSSIFDYLYIYVSSCG